MTGFDRLGEQIAREQDALLERRNAQAEVRERLTQLDLDAARSHGARPLWLWLGAGGTSLALAFAALVMLRVPHAQTLAVKLVSTGESLPIGRFVEAPSAAEVGLQFSDGSHIEVAEGGRARLVGLKSTGADVSLESGLIHVKVQHRSDSEWHIGAGPFGVHVTGTRFDVRWKPEDDAFELTLREGQVEVSGCAFGPGYRMQAGQTVRASCHTSHFEVSSDNETSTVKTPTTPTATAAATTAPEVVAPAATSEMAAASERVAAPKLAARPVANETRAPREADWLSLARAGRYAQALRMVRALGFDRECERARADELTMLANLARYGQDSDGEAKALQLVRERFRGTKQATRAAFALGRLEFDNHGAYAEAAEWFRTYLKEQPRGDLAREASGRLIEALQRSGDAAATREQAQRYLADYPDGPHAELARALTATNP
jgi:hypothetical protein